MIYILLIAIIFITDNYIKKYIEENMEFTREEEILNGNIIVTKYHNKGAMLNILEERKDIVLKVSSIILVIIVILFLFLIPKKGKKITKLGFAFIIGGAFSNIYDRFQKGYVVDYFSFKWLKKIVFNISDIFVFIGALLITIKSLFHK